ncbi:hypothetical protein [Streptomyces sp. LaPpAH-108]|uniref:hypothetical protein n=1 Tax=Streptomyces sp. LaPpAH-108 TaxID=1155714 RepID=UPI0003A72DFB|nr:hypothetical protein [Streptomyces sp. LaPpAH-108]
MAHRRRKPAPARTRIRLTAPPGRSRRELWREAGRRAVLGIAGGAGSLLVAGVEWWLRHH